MTYSSQVRMDYKSLLEPARRRKFASLHWWALGLAAIGGAALFVAGPEEATAHREAALRGGEQAVTLPLPDITATAGNPTPIQTPRTAKLSLPHPASSEPTRPSAAAPASVPNPPAVEIDPAADVAVSAPRAPGAEPAGRWETTTVRPGDSLARIFSRMKLSARELHDIMALGEPVASLKKIHPGETLRFRIGDDGRLLALQYDKNRLHGLIVERGDEGFSAREIARQPERETAYASATIDSSLFVAAQRAGLSDNLTMELANIFGWDIDFALDIRKGDRFTVLYENLNLDGERIGQGDILAAEFVNQGRVYRAVRYTDASGRTDYYTPEGRSMRKAFLRTPVAFSRISSRFSLGRRHPILNRIRAHKGVDYAASYGTPIKATGDGKVVFRGTKGGYGRTVILAHGSRYSTLYAHMSRIARGIRNGSRVKQGQVIGYIGQSGLATGPHLHYEFRINGVHRNPLTVKLPAAAPIDKRYAADFKRKSATLLAQLELVRERETQVALNGN